MKLKAISLANAFAITTAIIFVVCRLLVSLAPELMFVIAQSWLHGISLSPLPIWGLSIGTFLLGLLTSTAFAWITGYLIAVIYNR